MHRKIISSLAVLGVCCTPLASVAQHPDAFHQHYVRHSQWRHGYHMPPADWNRGQRVDNWRNYHLSAPPRGYEWREIDGNYVLAAVATGIVASVIAASASH